MRQKTARKIRTIKIERLFHGFASIRSYEWKEASEGNIDLKIINMTNGEHIMIRWYELGKCYENADQPIISDIYPKGHKYHRYYLVDFDWDTFRKKTDSQIQFDIFTSVKALEKV